VRLAQIPERGAVESNVLGKHQGRAHKLAIEPGSPHIFYTCGEDGLVQHVSYDSLLCCLIYNLFGDRAT
jgi:WD repeat-containing protein 42A